MRLWITLTFVLLTGTATATELVINYKSWISDNDRQHVETWLNHGMNAAERTLGELKQPALTATIEPILFASEPVPWGSVQRGRLDSLNLHVKRFTPSRILVKDWTIYHEIAHLYHPLLAHSDFWIAEGLATYLQNVIMLENSLFDINEFRARLTSGLNRGAKNTQLHNGGLSSVSENMWSLKAQQRVYWSGAAFFMEAELALKASLSPHTVRSLIAKFQQCCKSSHPSGLENSGRLFIAKLDKLSKTTIFSNLYASYKQRNDFPILSRAEIATLQPLR
ncbi:hypothetical protein [Pseudoalteromonas piscicida]|uniref:Peptidase M61 catalytic domain-containing protein n=1 Tax=Pseudoalteromonas piscicida TaxID=43662 RepID=A0A2A5JRZ2_PSEO7|nr:hypothetical protein [Pseudoalteromonas piscicida]PCK32160.1 hypothetical protein CEX98_08205 [Pseudoalteromonas piscicida]